MNKYFFVAAAIIGLAASVSFVHADSNITGNTVINSCDGGIFTVIEGSGHGEVLLSHRAVVLVFKNFPISDFKKTGVVKPEGNFSTWDIPFLTRYIGTGTLVLNGQNRIIVFGPRDGIELSGNYQITVHGNSIGCGE